MTKILSSSTCESRPTTVWSRWLARVTWTECDRVRSGPNSKNWRVSKRFRLTPQHPGSWLTFAIRYSLLLLVFAASTTFAAEALSWETLGARFGFPVDDRTKGFEEAEAFANCNLPWLWKLGYQWAVQSRLDFSAGWLGAHGDDAFIGSLGPSLLLSYKPWPVSLEAGSSPTLMTVHNFGQTDLGGAFQFTTHIGVNWDVVAHVRVGYRFEHISNAGIYHDNPGINFHMFALSYLF